MLVGPLCVFFFVQHFGEKELARTRWLPRGGTFVDVFFCQLELLLRRLGSLSPLRLVQTHLLIVLKRSLSPGKYQRFQKTLGAGKIGNIG